MERFIGPVTQSANSKTINEDQVVVSKIGGDILIPRDSVLEAKEDAEAIFRNLKFHTDGEIGEYWESPLFGDNKLYSAALKARVDRRAANLFPVSYENESTEAEFHDPIPLEMVDNGVVGQTLTSIVKFPENDQSNQYFFYGDAPDVGVESEIGEYSLMDIFGGYAQNNNEEKYLKYTGEITYAFANGIFGQAAIDPQPNSVYASGNVVSYPYFGGGWFGYVGDVSTSYDDDYGRDWEVEISAYGLYSTIEVPRPGKYLLEFNVSIVPGSVGTFPDTVSGVRIYNSGYSLIEETQSIELTINGLDNEIHVQMFSMEEITGTWNLTYIGSIFEDWDFYFEDIHTEASFLIRFEVGSPDGPKRNYYISKLIPMKAVDAGTLHVHTFDLIFTGRPIVWKEDPDGGDSMVIDFGKEDHIKCFVTPYTLPSFFCNVSGSFDYLGQEVEIPDS